MHTEHNYAFTKMIIFFFKLSNDNDRYCIFIFIDLNDNWLLELSVSLCMKYVLQSVDIKYVIQSLKLWRHVETS